MGEERWRAHGHRTAIIRPIQYTQLTHGPHTACTRPLHGIVLQYISGEIILPTAIKLVANNQWLIIHLSFIIHF